MTSQPFTVIPIQFWHMSSICMCRVIQEWGVASSGGRPDLVVQVGEEAQELPPLVGQQVPALWGHDIVLHVLA